MDHAIRSRSRGEMVSTMDILRQGFRPWRSGPETRAMRRMFICECRGEYPDDCGACSLKGKAREYNGGPNYAGWARCPFPTSISRRLSGSLTQQIFPMRRPCVGTWRNTDGRPRGK